MQLEGREADQGATRVRDLLGIKDLALLATKEAVHLAIKEVALLEIREAALQALLAIKGAAQGHLDLAQATLAVEAEMGEVEILDRTQVLVPASAHLVKQLSRSAVRRLRRPAESSQSQERHSPLDQALRRRVTKLLA